MVWSEHLRVSTTPLLASGTVFSSRSHRWISPSLARLVASPWDLPDIPELAQGGIVSQPTLALIGEKGPEAVVPLDKMTGNQTIIEVTVLGDLKAEDEKSLADAIGRVWWASGFSDQVLTNG